MKTQLISRFKGSYTILYRSWVLKIMLVFSILVFLLYLQSCGYYYKIKTQRNLINPKTLETIDLSGKYVILRSHGESNNLYNIQIIDDTVKGKLKPLAFNHIKNLNPSKRSGIRYKKGLGSDVLNEVHIYLIDTIKINRTSIAFPMSAIQKVHINSKDGAATAASWILPPVLTIGIIAGIVAATSCPFLYTNNGDYYELRGELFAGATYQSLERHDYMPLPAFKPIDGNYELKISNELSEIQYTNQCELFMIQHPVGSEVYIDKNGQIQSLTIPQFPLKSITTNGHDVSLAVREKDGVVFAFDDEGEDYAVNGLIVTFINKSDAPTGKLVVSAKNSVWADFAYGNFTNLFGTYYDDWENEQKKLSTEQMQKNALDQDIPLSIYIETKNGWEFIDYFNVVGPLNYKKMVIPIDLSKVKSKAINIKLETGFMFWELDYVSMDFSENIPVDFISLPLISADDENDLDIRSLVKDDDDAYLIQPEIGNEVILKFASDVNTINNDQFTKSIIFHSKGYYERIREFDNPPDWFSLLYHKHNHAFSKFSHSEFERLKELRFLAAQN